MSDLSPELNLALAVENDDTDDYLTQNAGLRGSLVTLDGLFNALTGHAHQGAHQGGTIGFQGLFAGATVSPSTNYVVAANVLYVFCIAAIAVTLPAAATTSYPINVAAVSGQSTVTASGGSVFGGSFNTTTGVVQDGVVVQGDAITYKSDGTNWRAV